MIKYDIHVLVFLDKIFSIECLINEEEEEEFVSIETSSSEAGFIVCWKNI
jgi:hypothetical protein